MLTGSSLRVFRAILALSQKDLAKLIGCSYATIAQIESKECGSQYCGLIARRLAIFFREKGFFIYIGEGDQVTLKIPLEREILVNNAIVGRYVVAVRKILNMTYPEFVNFTGIGEVILKKMENSVGECDAKAPVLYTFSRKIERAGLSFNIEGKILTIKYQETTDKYDR